MAEIRCPKCNEVFQIEQSNYDEIVKQVRDKEFKKELAEKEKLLEIQKQQMDTEKENAVNLAKEQMKALLIEELSEKEKQITELNTKMQSAEEAKQAAVKEAVMEKEKTILDLQSQISAEKSSRELSEEKSKANNDRLLAEKERKIAELNAKMESAEESKKAAVTEALSEKDKMILELKAQISAEKSNRELAEEKVKAENEKALSQKDVQIHELELKMETKEREYQLNERNIRESYETELRYKDDQIAQYKDMKLKLSTKMIGESLERHCETEFNKMRMVAFKDAYFEKDNDATTGSKGDYIYRELAPDGTELISIMFEMKNEMDETATKKKNEDFLKKLDKDRTDKKCEYAVLVSLLESDSEYYNSGIVDVSYQFPKMYVIRPQFFIPLISILRNAAMNSIEYRQQLAELRNQNIDIAHFEEELETFKLSFTKNVRNAGERFQEAIKEIDKAIKSLEETKSKLLLSEKHLLTADNKVDELSVKKLTRNNPTVAAMFQELTDKK